MKNVTEKLVEDLKKELGPDLRSVVVYGPAAVDSQNLRPEEVQVLVLCQSLGIRQLDALSRPVQRWVKKKHPMPKVFTWERLCKSTDVFPIECLEIQTRHHTVFGEDCIGQLEVPKKNLRLQLETEFKGKLVQLRESYLLLGGNLRELVKVMTVSLSTFESLFRALIYLLEDEIPEDLKMITEILRDKHSLDTQVLEKIQSVKNEPVGGGKEGIISLFVQYLRCLEEVSDYVDAFDS